MSTEASESMKFDVPIAALQLYRLCDPDSSRYALGGVQFTCDPQGVSTAAATDGRHLGQFQWKQTGDRFVPGSVIVSKNVVRLMARATRRLIDDSVLLDGDSIRHFSTETWLKFRGIEGRFPRVDDVFSPTRDFDRTSSRSINPHYLANLALIAKALDNFDFVSKCQVIFTGNNSDNVNITNERSGVSFRGAVMPIASGE